MGRPFTLDPKDVRKMATQIGVPSEAPIPVVQVEKARRGIAGELFRAKIRRKYLPQDWTDRENVSSDYLVILSEDELASQDKHTYTLGPEARETIRHELWHYLRRLEDPSTPFTDKMSLEDLVAWELDAEMRGGRPKASDVASLIVGLSRGWKIPKEEVSRVVRKAGLRMGVSNQLLARAENLAMRCP